VAFGCCHVPDTLVNAEEALVERSATYPAQLALTVAPCAVPAASSPAGAAINANALSSRRSFWSQFTFRSSALHLKRFYETRKRRLGLQLLQPVTGDDSLSSGLCPDDLLTAGADANQRNWRPDVLSDEVEILAGADRQV
jgi:hypothetical protein